MVKLVTFLLLPLAILGHFLPLAVVAGPLLSPMASADRGYAAYADAAEYDDDDDTEVIEIDTNAIDGPGTGRADSQEQDLIDLSFYGNAVYGIPDESTAALVANYTPDASSVNPEELGSYLEGDILIPRPTGDAAMTKNGVTTQSSRWPGGVVPFEVRGSFGAREMATIQNALEEYHRRTCIRFVPRTNQADYISIVSGASGCWSSVGRVGGKQEVNLQSPGCMGKPGTTMHELMHALGFLHEQNRQERDSYVAIQYENVQPNARTNFEKASATIAFGVQYDYGSVMHYSANAFSTNGRPTIVAVQPGASNMGQRDGFSALDVEKLNKMYNCDQNGGAAPIAGHAVVPNVQGPVPGAGAPNNIVGSFLGGLIAGLGLGDEETTVEPAAAI